MLYLHEATVEISGQFPLDMLRYDSCFPATSEDVAEIANSFIGCCPGHRRVRLHALSRDKAHWTPERWESFHAKIITTITRKG